MKSFAPPENSSIQPSHPRLLHRRRRRFRIADRLAIACLALLILSGSGCRQEIAKWQLAAGLNAYHDGDLDQGIEQLRRALATDPDNGQIKLALAQLLAEHHQGELGLALCDEYLQRYPDNERARRMRAVCLQFLGRFEESLAEYQAGVSGRIDRSPAELNNLAYFRALARRELPKAASQINEAIDQEQRRDWGAGYPASLKVRTAISIGLVSRPLGQQRDALPALRWQIERYSEKLDAQDSLLRQLVTEIMRLEFPPSDRRLEQTSLARASQEIVRSSLAMLLATRCLLYEDLRWHEKADQDRLRLRELGWEFPEIASQLPPLEACLQVLETSATFLDTRGFVMTRLRWQSPEFQQWANELAMNQIGLLSSYEAALADLNLAVIASEIHQAALRSPLYNRSDLPVSAVLQARNEADRMTAVLLYHRMEAHLKAGQEQLANCDRKRILALGFEPDDSLF